MAGAILVSKNNGVSLKSLDFDYIVEKIRDHFRSGEEVVRDEIYNPMDDGGMSFISLIEQKENGFNAFVRATSLAYEEELKSGLLLGRQYIWDELIAVLHSDSRIKISG